MSKFISLVFSLLLLAVVFSYAMESEVSGLNEVMGPEAGATLIVPVQYTKIQYAIDNATEGDTIRVYSGTYEEYVDIDKTLTLIGNGSGKTVVKHPTESPLTINAAHVNVSDLMLTGTNTYGMIITRPGNNAYISHVNITYNGYGMYTRGKNGVIENCSFYKNTYRAIYQSAENFTIKDTVLNGHTTGIYITEGEELSIIGNRIMRCSEDGIESTSISGIVNARILDNIVIDCQQNGIALHYISGSKIKGNQIGGCGYYGLDIYSKGNDEICDNVIFDCTGGMLLYGDENDIRGNTITENTALKNDFWSLYGYWPIDEDDGRGVLDVEGNRDGWITGTNSYRFIPGRFGNCYENYYESVIQVNTTYMPTYIWSPFTISMYIWPDPEGFNVDRSSTLFFWGNYTETNGMVEMLYTDGPTVIPALTMSFWGSALNVSVPSLTDAWHHVAFEYGAGNRRIYLDGILVGTDSNPSLSITNLTGVYIGGNNQTDSVSDPFKGRIDDVRYYGGSLGTYQVSMIYRNGIHLRKGSENNDLHENFIGLNTHFGIFIEDGCSGNRIYNNNIQLNGDASQVIDHSPDMNRWNISYPMGGNYWSDHEGRDYLGGSNQDIPGSDGISDIPHDFSSSWGYIDEYPLYRQYGYGENDRIMISSHVDGEPVSGIEKIKVEVFAQNVVGVSFFESGLYMGYDSTYPYEMLMDVTYLAEDVVLKITAAADLLYGGELTDTVDLLVNNQVQNGYYSSLSIQWTEYEPDQIITANVSLAGEPKYDSLAYEFHLIPPAGDPVFMGHFMLRNDSNCVLLPIASDISPGSYSVKVMVSGYLHGELYWESHDSIPVTISGISVQDGLGDILSSLSDMDLRIEGAVSDLGQIRSDLSYMNETIMDKLDSITLDIETAGSEMRSRLDLLEANLSMKLDGMNSSLQGLFGNALANILGRLDSVDLNLLGIEANLSSELAGVQQDVLDYLDMNFDMMLLYMNILNGSINKGCGEIKALITSVREDIRGDLVPGLDEIKDHLLMMNSTASEDTDEILAAIDESEDLMRNLNYNTLVDLRARLFEISEYLAEMNESTATDHMLMIDTFVSKIDDLNHSMAKNLSRIEISLETLALLESILDDLEEVDNGISSAEKTLERNDSNLGLINILTLILSLASVGLLIYLIIAVRRKEEKAESWN
ncbi:MAG: right-handed parallel beta-helix repeat-containing protein [Thermoplasmatota archaeon]